MMDLTERYLAVLKFSNCFNGFASIKLRARIDICVLELLKVYQIAVEIYPRRKSDAPICCECIKKLSNILNWPDTRVVKGACCNYHSLAGTGK